MCAVVYGLTYDSQLSEKQCTTFVSSLQSRDGEHDIEGRSHNFTKHNCVKAFTNTLVQEIILYA